MACAFLSLVLTTMKVAAVLILFYSMLGGLDGFVGGGVSAPPLGYSWQSPRPPLSPVVSLLPSGPSPAIDVIGRGQSPRPG